MTIKEKLKKIFINQREIAHYEKNKAAKMLWNHITSYNIRTGFEYAFSRCDFSGVEFVEEILPTASINHMFYYYQGSFLPKGINLSKVARATSTSALFARSELVEIPDLNLKAMNEYHNTFLDCESLKKIALLRSHKTTKYTNTFSGCLSLASISFEGEIGRDISFSRCTRLTRESIKNIMNHLCDYTAEGGTYKLILGRDNLSKLTEEEQQIAIDKGWTLI